MMRFETQLQAKLIDKIREKYRGEVWIFKTHDLCRVGVPDILICFYGHFVAIELKNRPALRIKTNINPALSDSDTTQMQQYNIRKINEAGGSAFVGRSITPVMDRLDRIYKSLKLFEAHK